MMTLTLIALALAAFPAGLFLTNLVFYRRLPEALLDGNRLVSGKCECRGGSRLSVLIPARNEAQAIGLAVEAVLANVDAEFEVLVLDDHSSDGTGDIVAELAARDPRVRLIRGSPLPDGWCGKQHACWQLAHEARHELLVFLDADVRLAPGALTRIAAWFAERPRVDLASGVPRQITGTFLERLLIPLIHFVLLGYLPIAAARLMRWTAFAAGCGQLFVARRDRYFASGGHRAIRASLHDGVKLPRQFRSRGFQTDLFDATDLAFCRMYTSAAEVWRGLGKNATEGMAHPGAILPWSILLLGGQVLPWGLLLTAAVGPAEAQLPAGIAVACTLLPRLVGVGRFRQSLVGALLHPAGITVLMVIQWLALVGRWRGRPSEWRGRRYPPDASFVPDSSTAL